MRTLVVSRRRFLQGGLALAGVGLVSGCGMLPQTPRPSRPFRIGYLGARPLEPGVTPPGLAALHLGMQELGYVDGQDYTIEVRSTAGIAEQAPDLVAELLRLPVDLLYTSGTPNALAARQATREVPIVVATNGDLVAVGLVASLSRPGGNVTGVSTLAPLLSGKRLELLRETVPSITRLGLLAPAAIVSSGIEVQETRAVAQTLGLPIEVGAVGAADELPSVFARLVDAGVGGLLVAEDAYYSSSRDRIVGLAAEHRLPTIYTLRDFVNGGGLMSYGASVAEAHRRGAAYVDKIRKGAKPSELPVEQPTTFELAVNLKTAQTLGLTIPPSVLQQATEVIQ